MSKTKVSNEINQDELAHLDGIKFIKNQTNKNKTKR
jgi:hypothetical protein